MEGLIKKMNAISLKDSDYALCIIVLQRWIPLLKVAAPIKKGDSTLRTDSKQNNLPGQRDNQYRNNYMQRNHAQPDSINCLICHSKREFVLAVVRKDMAYPSVHKSITPLG
jgi:hypothetical protein